MLTPHRAHRALTCLRSRLKGGAATASRISYIPIKKGSLEHTYNVPPRRVKGAQHRNVTATQEEQHDEAPQGKSFAKRSVLRSN